LKIPNWKSRLAFVVALLAAGSACRQDMHDQPKYRPYAKAEFFPNSSSARPLVANTIARGWLREDPVMYKGKASKAADAAFVTTLPMPVTKALLERGRERYNIYCSPCHDQLGQGNGMIVQRGYKQPPSYHTDKMRQQPVGYFFDVISNGFGVMPAYANRIPVADRWAITAYVRVLQLSQDAREADVPVSERPLLDQPIQTAQAATSEEGH
jgi:mono/diheme cytochrome c family protein